MLRFELVILILAFLRFDLASAQLNPPKLKACQGGLTAVTHSTDLNDAGEVILRMDRFPLREWSSESQFEELLIPTSNFQKINTELEMKVHFMEGSRYQFSSQAKIEAGGSEKKDSFVARWPLLKNQLKDQPGKLTALAFVLSSADEEICEYLIPFIQGH